LEDTGQKHISEGVLAVLKGAWRSGFTTKSDFAREHADYVAMAACLGLITTRITLDVWGREWQISAKGLHMLESHYGINTDAEEA